MKFFSLFSLGVLASLPLHAAVTPASMFTDHAVLQQGLPVPVWGKADPGEKVTVTYQGSSQSATTGPDGKWKAVLPALKAGLSGDFTIQGSNTITLHDIVTGEVWLCSGQSNMGFGLQKATNAAAEIASANYPQIRAFVVRPGYALKPLDTTSAQWAVCSPATAGGFSAVAYYFARDLYKALNTPVGIICASNGGTIAETWISRDAMAADPKLAEVLKRWDDAAPGFATTKVTYEQQMTVWKAAALAHQQPGLLPKMPAGSPGEAPGANFNNSISPLIPYAIKGVLWYQGESNAPRGGEYHELCKALILDWRARWQQGPFTFIIMQLPRHNRASAIDPTGISWAYLREAQNQLLDVENTGLIVPLELGDSRNLHPPGKEPFGQRAANVALALDYGKKDPYLGPFFHSAQVQGNGILVTFDHSEGGLSARDGKPLAGFQIAGADNHFVDAVAVIKGSTVLVSSPQVTTPKFVRYAFRNDPIEANLVGAAGLPAAPFRTDNVPQPK